MKQSKKGTTTDHLPAISQNLSSITASCLASCSESCLTLLLLRGFVAYKPVTYKKVRNRAFCERS